MDRWRKCYWYHFKSRQIQCRHLTLPLKLGILGGFLSVACFIVFIVLACCKIYFGGLVAWLFPFVALSGSIALVCHGLSNIYISMVYREVQSRPKYIVAEKINL